jgi:hypothetical protein
LTPYNKKGVSFVIVSAMVRVPTTRKDAGMNISLRKNRPGIFASRTVTPVMSRRTRREVAGEENAMQISIVAPARSTFSAG